MDNAPQAAFQATVAEFFAGAGLVRTALNAVGFTVSFANDIEPKKHRIYEMIFGPSPEFALGDIRNISGQNVATVDLATASFPCTDLSLAGNRKGLAGEQSGAFHEFARVLEEMGSRRPPLVMLENVLGFATSHGGKDLRTALLKLNELGYACDLFTLDAKWFVAQSRVRLFVIGRKLSTRASRPLPLVSPMRPTWLVEFMMRNRDVRFSSVEFPTPPRLNASLSGVVERIDGRSDRWWSSSSSLAFLRSLTPLQKERLGRMISAKRLSWATAYRRTRNGAATWEIRADDIAGCLRTTRGGSSKQAVVEAGRGSFRVRWMTAREYARLQGADDFIFAADRENEAMFALGDGVCVPVIRWIAEHYLRPALETMRARRAA
jgi:DNA (cytosine-5)-methyltransferase 1